MLDQLARPGQREKQGLPDQLGLLVMWDQQGRPAPLAEWDRLVRQEIPVRQEMLDQLGRPVLLVV